MRILMSAAASAAAISIIKHLQTLGHKVIGIDANENSKSIAMHFCDDFYLSPLCSSSEFIPFINQLDDKFDLYIPFIDE
jgi:carbamoyl-phosphate synthase large subunit